MQHTQLLVRENLFLSACTQVVSVLLSLSANTGTSGNVKTLKEETVPLLSLQKVAVASLEQNHGSYPFHVDLLAVMNLHFLVCPTDMDVHAETVSECLSTTLEWLRVLSLLAKWNKNDKKAVIQALSLVAKTVSYLVRVSSSETTEPVWMDHFKRFAVVPNLLAIYSSLVSQGEVPLLDGEVCASILDLLLHIIHQCASLLPYLTDTGLWTNLPLPSLNPLLEAVTPGGTLSSSGKCAVVLSSSYMNYRQSLVLFEKTVQVYDAVLRCGHGEVEDAVSHAQDFLALYWESHWMPLLRTALFSSCVQMRLLRTWTFGVELIFTLNRIIRGQAGRARILEDGLRCGLPGEMFLQPVHITLHFVAHMMQHAMAWTHRLNTEIYQSSLPFWSSWYTDCGVETTAHTMSTLKGPSPGQTEWCPRMVAHLESCLLMLASNCLAVLLLQSPGLDDWLLMTAEDRARLLPSINFNVNTALEFNWNVALESSSVSVGALIGIVAYCSTQLTKFSSPTKSSGKEEANKCDREWFFDCKEMGLSLMVGQTLIFLQSPHIDDKVKRTFLRDLSAEMVTIQSSLNKTMRRGMSTRSFSLRRTASSSSNSERASDDFDLAIDKFLSFLMK